MDRGQIGRKEGIMSDRIYLNDNWKFTEEFTKEFADREEAGCNLREVRLPHTCKETPFHYFDEQIYQMVSGYKRILSVPEEWKGKKVLLTFDGVAHDSEVYLNGRKMGEHQCGYTAFCIDISEALKYGEDNLLAVKVDSRENLNIPPFGFVIDYMTYGGIYRDVYLEVKNPVYLADIFHKSRLVLPENEKEDLDERKIRAAELLSESTVNTKADGLRIRQKIRTKNNRDEKLLGECSLVGEKQTICFLVDEVCLWDTERPTLYEITTELLSDGRVVDEKTICFGFRQAEFKTDGFYLNGKKVRLRGLNRHQSYPYVGYAMPESMQKLDADILKNELGVNAVRTSHYPQSHYFLDRCDELGLLVFTEIPGWQHIGDEEWKNQAVNNVRDMVLQYRNHTSIILWGVRINESQDDDTFYQRTNKMAHDLDDSRPTGGVRAHKKSSLLEDVYTYNDFLHDGKTKGCEKKNKVTSDKKKPYLVSEFNGHMYPTKAFDWEEHRVWHALRHANVLDAVMAEDDIAGCFGWCMFDYNTHKDFGSGDRICYHGVMDMFRNPKMAAAVYASQQEQTPVLEISSSMDIGEHPATNRGDTYIFTNADKVRMYKNDHFLKEYTKTDSSYRSLSHGPIRIEDYIGDALAAEHFPKKKEEGIKKVLNAYARYGMSDMPKTVWITALWLILRYRMSMNDAVELYTKYVGNWGSTSTKYRFDAVKIDAEGRETVVKTVIKEPMQKVLLKVTTDHTDLEEKHSYDVAAVRFVAQDANGNILNFYNEPVMLEAEGPICIIGPKAVSLQGGMGGTYVKTTGQEGEAALIIQTEQAGRIKIPFSVKKNNDIFS